MHAKVDQRKRNTRQAGYGYSTKHWQQVKRAVLERDDHTCRMCLGMDDLTVHLSPAYGGNHAIAHMDDCVTLCRVCHGITDGARASRP